MTFGPAWHADTSIVVHASCAAAEPAHDDGPYRRSGGPAAVPVVRSLVYTGGHRAPVLRRFETARGIRWERRLPGQSLHPRHVCVVGAVAIAPRASGGLKGLDLDRGEQIWQLVHGTRLAPDAGLVRVAHGDVDAYFADGSRLRIEPVSGRVLETCRWSVPDLPAPPRLQHVTDALRQRWIEVDRVAPVGDIVAARGPSLFLPGDERCLEPSRDRVTWLVEPHHHTLLARLAQHPRASVIMDAGGMPLFRGML